MASTYPDWLFDETPIPDPQGRAERVLRFADAMKHPSSKDGTLELTAWQRRLLQRVYGPVNEHNNRQVRTVFILLPRGNRKTTLASVMALCATIGPEAVPNGQVVSAAGDRSQASIAFDEATAIIREDPRFNAAAKVTRSNKRIVHKRSRSVFQAISADGDMQHGKTPTMVIADELHVWKGYNLFNALRTGLNKVAQPLLVVITTAGIDPKGVCWDLYQYARKVASGDAEDATFLPILFEDDDHEIPFSDEDLWHRVNPGLAYGFPDIEGLRDMARQAKSLPTQRVAFEQLHLNRWGDGSAAGWVDMVVYDRGAEPALNPDMFVREECVVGVDMSSSYDLTAVVAAFRMDGGVALLPTFFLPEETVQKRALESEEPWEEWVEQGHIVTTPGAVIDEQLVENHVRHLCDTYQVTEIASDPFKMQRMGARMLQDGLPVVEFPQRYLTMSPAITETQRLILSGGFHHGGNPVLRFCFANVVPVYDDTGNVRFSKRRSRESIDGAIASVMAVQRLSAEPTVSIYDTDQRPDGLLFL